MPGVEGLARLRDLGVIIRKPAIDVFCRCKNKDGILTHVLKDVDRAFNICQKNLVGRQRILVQVGGEMDNHVILFYNFYVA